jgi:predicted RND superfamily exporter protein
VLITPAVLCVLPVAAAPHEAETEGVGFVRLGNWLMGSYRQVVWVSGVLVLVMLVGLFRLETKIDPLDFLPKQSKAMRDVQKVEAELTNIDSIEAVVDFSGSELAFVDRLKQVRAIEQSLRTHPSVRHTMSASAFFPEQLPENALALMKVLQKAESRRGNNEFIVGDERLWRISARIDKSQGRTVHQVYHDLQTLTAGQPVHFTGIAPLLEQAQHEIFDGFWKSFTSAFVVLLIVMVAFLRSVKMAVLAMVPNIAPLCVVFGFLGWTGLPVDIGIMMTASIALGISVDGTFHYLVRYQEQCDLGRSGTQAVRVALLTTGGPIFESIVVSSIGMLALTLSSFAPTARFGLLMASLLVAALAGDLLLLPSLLALRPVKRAAKLPPPKPVIAERAIPATHGSAIPTDRVA